MGKPRGSDIKMILKRFFLTVFLLTAAAAVIIGTQYAGDKTQLQLEGKGYETITPDSIKNSCIIFFGMLK